LLKVAHRTLELLEYICTSPQKEFSVTELSQRLGLNKTKVYRMLRVLAERDYLRHDEKTGRYHLGLKPLELGTQVAAKTGLLEVVSPYMEKLSREIKETINLAVMRSNKIVYIHKIESPHFLRTDLRVGTSVPVYCSALGKAMLAWLPEQEQEKILGALEMVAYTPHTITCLEDLKLELKRIRDKGYAVDNEEYISGITCIAAPILDGHKKPVAAISAAGPSLRLNGEKITQSGELIARYAAEISFRYGYSK